METSTPKKVLRCKQCGGPTKGHAALGSKPGVKNCSNPRWVDEEQDAAGAMGNVVGVIMAQADATAKEQGIAGPGTSRDAGQVEDQVDLRQPPLHSALTKLLPRKSVFSETDNELPEEAQANSFEMPSFEVGKRDVKRERVVSSSDAMVDVRTIVAGKVFAICMCDEEACECPGEVKFGPDVSSLAAVLAGVEVFEDPVTQADWRPALALARGGWTADHPNTVAMVPSIAAKGVSVKGKVVVEALRVVEVVKGRKVIDKELTLTIDKLEIKLPAAYVKKGIKSPLVLERMTASLYQLDEPEDDAQDSEADDEEEASAAEVEASLTDQEEDVDEDAADIKDLSSESFKSKDEVAEDEVASGEEEFNGASENEESYEENLSKETKEEETVDETENEENIGDTDEESVQETEEEFDEDEEEMEESSDEE